MAWNPNSIAGLTYVNNEQDFEYRENLIALSGHGGIGDGAVSASFSYDDTAWGGVPAGIFKTLATCAVNPFEQDGTMPSGKYVQLRLGILRELGRDYASTAPSPPTNHGTITAFGASMRGFGALNFADASTGADLGLPWDTSLTVPPTPYLLRPTPLRWPGQDDNEAVPTIWLQSEVSVVTYGFAVQSQSANVWVNFNAVGWT